MRFVLAVALIVAFASVSQSPAATSRGKGVLAFVSDRYGDRFLYTISLRDGSVSQPLSTSDQSPWRPVVSPDGSRIAFSSTEVVCLPAVACYYEGHIWVVNTDGSGLTQVTTAPGTYDFEPAWTADGRTIVFARSRVRVPEWGDLYSVTESESGEWVEELFLSRPGAEYSLDFSPDGKRLAYTYVVDDDRFYDEGEDDYAVENGEIVIAKADGSGPHRRLKLPGSEEAQPVWSPDGKKIAFTRWRIQPDWEPIGIWTVRPDRTHMRHLIRRRASEPTWASHGKGLFFMRCYHVFERSEKCAIALFDVLADRIQTVEDVPGVFDGMPHVGGFRP